MLRSKGSSQCGVATENNGGLWWLIVAVGDGESAWDVRNDFGRKKGEEMAFFLSYTKAKVEMLK